MLKKLTIILLAFLILLSCSISALAYEPNDFSVSAEAGMLVSLDTGEVIFEKNIDKKVYPASIAKIMTVTLMLESDRFNAEGKVVMSEDVDKYITGTGSAVSNIKVGEEITQLDLVYLVLMGSKGDCTYLAALYYGDTVENFVDMMNKRAGELGLTGTHYGNPVGLHDEQTYTTVRDIRVLTEHALKNEIFKTVCESKRYKMPATNMSGERTISTTNFLHDNTTNYYYAYAKGVKTGFTSEAGRCLVSTASYNGYNYMCILMKCPSNAPTRVEFTESANLYRWAFNNFEFKKIADSQNPVCEIPVELSFQTDFMPLYIEKGFVSVMPKNADTSTITIIPHLKGESADAPIKKGDVLGTADIVYAEKVIGKVDLVAGSSASQSKLLVVARGIKQVFTSGFMKVVYGILIVLAIIFVVSFIRLNLGRSKRRKVKYIPYDKENKK